MPKQTPTQLALENAGLRARLTAAESRAASAEQEVAQLEGMIRDIHAALGRGDHGPTGNAACALSAISEMRMAADEERANAEKAEKEVARLEGELAAAWDELTLTPSEYEDIGLHGAIRKALDRKADERDTARRELADAKRAGERLLAECESLGRELAAERERRERLAGWIRENGRHGLRCMTLYAQLPPAEAENKCSCGLRELRDLVSESAALSEPAAAPQGDHHPVMTYEPVLDRQLRTIADDGGEASQNQVERMARELLSIRSAAAAAADMAALRPPGPILDRAPCCSSAHEPPDTACRAFSQGLNGRCVYCDHEQRCHPGPGATCEIGSGESGTAQDEGRERRFEVTVVHREEPLFILPNGDGAMIGVLVAGLDGHRVTLIVRDHGPADRTPPAGASGAVEGEHR